MNTKKVPDILFVDVKQMYPETVMIATSQSWASSMKF
jgi:uncharacterized protein YpiB (UPF0302 family)